MLCSAAGGDVESKIFELRQYKVLLEMLNNNVDFNNRQAIHEKLLTANALMLGALAWRGYQLKNTGAIVVYGLKESEDSCEESMDVEIGYLSKEEAVQTYPEAIGLFHLVDEYDPNKEMVVSFTDKKNSLVESYCLTLALPPLKCYILLQERLLKCDLSGIRE